MASMLLAGCLYAILAIGGLIVSGMPVAYWKGVVQPGLLVATASGRKGPRGSLISRVAGAIALAALFALLAIAMSPLTVYRCLWEMWHWAKRRGPRSPPPRKEPAVAKRVRAA